MEFLNRAAAQLRDLFGSMTPGARVTAGLLLAVVVISLGYLFHYQVTGPDGYLMGGTPFSMKQLQSMQAAFGDANLADYDVTTSGQIRVPKGKQAKYMAALADAGALPPQFGTYMDQAFRNGSLLEGPTARKERLKSAKQKELARMIGEMEGIAPESVSVFFETQAPKGFQKDFIATATVALATGTGEPLTTSRVRNIRKAVAGAILGLSSENVTVADANGNTYQPGADGMIDALEDPYLALKTRYEKLLSEKISGQIGFVRGARVQVNAELDRELRHEEKTVKHDPKTVDVARKTTSKTQSRTGGQPAGVPGINAQGGPGAGAVTLASSQTTESTEAQDEEEAKSLTLQTQTTLRELKGLVPKQIRVSVAVPTSHYRDVWNERKRAADGQEPTGTPDAAELQRIAEGVEQQIRVAILPLLEPRPEGVDPLELVHVASFDALTPKPVSGPSTVEQAVAWISTSWSTLAMFGMALFGLLMVRSMVKSVPPAEPAPSLPMPELPAAKSEPAPAEDADSDAAEDGPRRHFVKGPSVKDELAAMVREDPDTAASILRNWIAHAG